MKKYTLLIFLFLILFSACEQVVNIDLNDVAPALVVEGRIYQDSLARVQIKQTTSYFNPDSQLCICDALVSISQDDSPPETLQYVDRGLYVSSGLRGQAGSVYSLKVLYQGIVYESQSELYARPVIYNLEQRSFASFGSFGDSSGTGDGGGGFGGGFSLDSIPYFLFVNLYDDAGVDNYYLFDYFVNGEQREGSYIVGDDDNAKNDTLSYSPGPVALFFPGDTITVRANAIDRGVYTYFDQLGDAISSNSFFSSTPYNPLSNISNGALGYFAAISRDADTTIIVPENIEFPF